MQNSPPNKGPGSGRSEFFPVKLCPASDAFLLFKLNKIQNKQKIIIKMFFFFSLSFSCGYGSICFDS
jgi:hypothetical protein